MSWARFWLVLQKAAKAATFLLTPLRRAVTKARPTVAIRSRLGILALEDCVVPAFPSISIATIADTTEGGSAGSIQFTRQGSTAGTLSVTYAIGGTATPSDDYSARVAGAVHCYINKRGHEMMVQFLVVIGFVLPVEYVVDCTSCPREGKSSFKARFEDRDGRQHTTELFNEDATPASLTLAIESYLNDCGWSCERIDNRILVIRGSRTAPVRSVTFVGQGWAPDVYARPSTYPWRPLAPPPREVKK